MAGTRFLCVALAVACAVADDPYAPLGPLKDLVGTWVGVVGKLRIPEGTRGPGCFYERTTFTPMWHSENQILNQTTYALHYEIQIHCPFGHPIHHETGQWRWMADRNMVVRIANVPTGQVLVAGGGSADGAVRVSTAFEGPGIGIMDLNFDSQVPTVAFTSEYHFDAEQNTLWYFDNTTLRINGSDFAHTAANCLGRMNSPLSMSMTKHKTAQCPGANADLFCGKSCLAEQREDDAVLVGAI